MVRASSGAAAKDCIAPAVAPAVKTIEGGGGGYIRP